MRVAYVIEMWKPSINGVVTRLSATIDELIDSGNEVLLIAPHVPGDRNVDAANRPGLQVHRVASFRIPFIYGGQPWGFPLPRVKRHLKSFNAEVIHIVTPAMLGLAGLFSAKQLRVPLVASFHTDIAAYARFYRLGFLAPFVWWWLRQIHNAAAINLVTSSHSARLLAEHEIQRVVPWRRGVDVRLFDPARRWRPALGSDTGPAIGLYVGRLAWEKGIQRLLPLARSGIITLRIVGDGPDRVRLEKVFAGTPTEFVGALAGDALADAYANADVFIFPSTTETLGLVLLEAFASGLPIVAAESPASRELLDLSPAARLFPAERPDLAERAVRDLFTVALVEDLAAAARAEALGWDWSTATAHLLDDYASVIASSIRKPDRGSHRSRSRATRPETGESETSR